MNELIIIGIYCTQTCDFIRFAHLALTLFASLMKLLLLGIIKVNFASALAYSQLWTFDL